MADLTPLENEWMPGTRRADTTLLVWGVAGLVLFGLQAGAVLTFLGGLLADV